jgi:hypothetical protein
MVIGRAAYRFPTDKATLQALNKSFAQKSCFGTNLCRAIDVERAPIPARFPSMSQLTEETFS